MDFLQELTPDTAFLLAVVCALLCGAGIVLFLGLQIIGTAFELFSSILGLFMDVLGGGPTSWCGCLLFVFGCFACAGLAILASQALATCGTPNAVNLCRLLGQ